MDKEEIDNKVDKEDEDMQSTLKEKPVDLKTALKKISSKTPILSGPKGKIKLDPSNKDHREWYEDDGAK